MQSPLSLLTYKGDVNVCLKYVTTEQLLARRHASAAHAHASASLPARPTPLSPSSSTVAPSGELRGGELLVLVKQARNLTAVRSNGFSDPFCKWYVDDTIHTHTHAHTHTHTHTHV